MNTNKRRWWASSICVHLWLSPSYGSRRFNVGRSSLDELESVDCVEPSELLVVLSLAVEVRRKVGRPSLLLLSLPPLFLRLCIVSKRPFTSSNSEVVTMCSARPG